MRCRSLNQYPTPTLLPIGYECVCRRPAGVRFLRGVRPCLGRKRNRCCAGTRCASAGARGSARASTERGKPPAPQHDHAAQPSEQTMMDMTGALGAYPMTRDASGTSWQPDATPHAMGHDMAGDWMLMGHVHAQRRLRLAGRPARRREGVRRRHDHGHGAARFRQRRHACNLRAMLSPDPFMGKSGYPLLLAAGETADGVTPLVDRQHPHDLFMELSASLQPHARQRRQPLPLCRPTRASRRSARRPSCIACRPWTAPKRRSRITGSTRRTSPSAWSPPAGCTTTWKLEVSRFTGREPDQDRFDIEEPKLD